MQDLHFKTVETINATTLVMQEEIISTFTKKITKKMLELLDSKRPVIKEVMLRSFNARSAELQKEKLEHLTLIYHELSKIGDTTDIKPIIDDISKLYESVKYISSL